MSIRISLFGHPQILIDDTPQEKLLGYSRLSALISYLAITGTSHTRRAIALLFWPDLDSPQALRNLRVELHRLGNQFALGHLISTTRTEASLNQSGELWIDVTFFQRAVDDPHATFIQLEEAVTLYRGGLLADFTLPDAPDFDDWLRIEQQNFQVAYEHLLLRLTRLCLAEERYDQGVHWGYQLLNLDLYQEEVYLLLMEMLARTDQRVKALELYELCDVRLNQELGVDLSPEIHKMAEQIELGTIGPNLSLRIHPSSQETSTDILAPFQAPEPPPHFAGRIEEVNQLSVQLQSDGDARIVALVGMGGIGKSTLAAKLAHALFGFFTGGVLWAYVGNSDPFDILGAWAQALGRDFSSITDVDNRAAALRNLVHGKRILLVLDDVRSAARARLLLPHNPAGATLLTSQDHDTAGALQAQIFPLQPLKRQSTLQLMSHLLGERRIASERKAAEEIGELLQDLPLAIEIAAQRLVARPHLLQRQARQLQQVQNRLNLSVSDVAVRTSITVSWDTLDRIHQRIFALLGLFQGRSFTAPAISHIAQLDDIYKIEDYLFNLAVLSLLTIEEKRYRQHGLLADFAQEKLEEIFGFQRQLLQNFRLLEETTDASGDVRKRYISYYLSFAQRHQTDRMAIRSEWKNILAAMTMADKQKMWRQVLDYTLILDTIWLQEGRYAEAEDGYRRACVAAAQLEESHTLAHFLRKQAIASLEQAKDAQAAILLERSLNICRQIGDPKEEAEALYYLGRLAVEQKEFAQGQVWLEACRTILHSIDDQAKLAHTYYIEADGPYYEGDYEKAKQLGEKALEIHLAQEDYLGCIQCLGLLADCATKQAQYAIAEGHCEKALAFCAQIDDQVELPVILYTYGEVMRLQREYATAVEHLQQALKILTRMGDKRTKARTLHRLGRVELDRNEIDQAIQAVNESYQINQELRNEWNQILDLDFRATIHEIENEREAARNCWHKAWVLCNQFEYHPLKEQLGERFGVI
ncbi:MAG: tetratricopeptide repeat protein [Chloroflexota bacterium]